MINILRKEFFPGMYINKTLHVVIHDNKQNPPIDASDESN